MSYTREELAAAARFEAETAQPPRERPGQAVFNALLRVDPAFAERVRGTELDPFHHDARIAGALAWWRDTLTGAEDIS